MASLEANGITIEYEIDGEGTPLMLIMGLGGQLTDWPPAFVSSLVERGFQVIRFDNRDIGLSTEFSWTPPTTAQALRTSITPRKKAEAGYLLSDMAADAAALLRGLNIPVAHVVGMSMGGMIAQTLAYTEPTMVASLTSIMSNTGDTRNGRVSPRLLPKVLRMPTPSRATHVDQTAEMFEMISGPEFDEHFYRETCTANLERSYRPAGTDRQLAAIMASPDRTSRLADIIAPTLVIHGMVDPLVMPSGGMATAKAIPGARLLMFPDMGHDLPPSRYEEMIDAIIANAHRQARTNELV